MPPQVSGTGHRPIIHRGRGARARRPSGAPRRTRRRGSRGPARCISSAGTSSPSGARRSCVAIASPSTQVSNPRFPAMRAVVEQQWSVVSPTSATVSTPCSRRRCSRSVPMNALLTSLVMTGSPLRGSASGLNSNAGVPGTNRPPGSALAWRTWMTGAPRSRQPRQRLGDPLLGAGVVAGRPGRVVERALDVDHEEGRRGQQTPNLGDPPGPERTAGNAGATASAASPSAARPVAGRTFRGVAFGGLTAGTATFGGVTAGTSTFGGLTAGT